MRWIDRARISLRYTSGRAVESILVAAATAVGVALVASMVAFIEAYGDQTESLLNHPAYREVVVEVLGNETELTEPAVPFDAGTSAEIRLGAANLAAVAEAVPAIAFAYIADPTRFSTTIAGVAAMRGGGGGTAGAGGAGGGGVAPGARGAGSSSGGDGEGSGGGADGGRVPFDVEELLATDPDVITDLPLETFGGALVTADFFAAYGLETGSGSLFTDDDVEAGNQVVVLGAGLAAALFPAEDPVGKKVRLNLRTLTIVGVLAPNGLRDVETGIRLDEVAFAPNSEAQISFGGRTVQIQRPTRTLRFSVTDSALTATARSQLQAYFDAAYGESTVRVTAPVEEVAAEREKHGRVLAVVLFLAAAALFIASINLFNLMLMRVIRRTKNIGISRAIGASRREVFRSFLNESALMSLIGAALGLVASPFVYGLLREALVVETAASATASWVYLVIGAVSAFAFSLVFGVWPARQAARTDASLAIRTE